MQSSRTLHKVWQPAQGVGGAERARRRRERAVHGTTQQDKQDCGTTTNEGEELSRTHQRSGGGVHGLMSHGGIPAQECKFRRTFQILPNLPPFSLVPARSVPVYGWIAWSDGGLPGPGRGDMGGAERGQAGSSDMSVYQQMVYQQIYPVGPRRRTDGGRTARRSARAVPVPPPPPPPCRAGGTPRR
eukprot:gene10349-biopygen21307